MQQVATYRTLSVAVLPKETVFRNALLVTAAVVFIALAAQVTWNYPVIETRAWEPVPITGQTFAILVTSALLGSSLGAAAVLAYLVAGFSGARVFADASGD